MKLEPKPFADIIKKKKTIELRLRDKKRQAIKPGDIIRFNQINDPQSYILTKVVNIYSAETFADLFKTIPLDKCGYSKDDLNSVSPEERMNEYYSIEQQLMYGVLGIEIIKIEHV